MSLTDQYIDCIEGFLAGKDTSVDLLRESVAYLNWFALKEQAKCMAARAVLDLPDEKADQVNAIADMLPQQSIEFELDPELIKKINGGSQNPGSDTSNDGNPPVAH